MTVGILGGLFGVSYGIYEAGTAVKNWLDKK